MLSIVRITELANQAMNWPLINFQEGLPIKDNYFALFNRVLLSFELTKTPKKIIINELRLP
jgi:hypothetical protein